ncbi:MAG: glycerol kinase GlpK [Actinomycetales bacterium]|nr:glycerol kinase GlpK [Actinomycetales bacterium]
MPSLLAIDAGTTGITALVVDEQAVVRSRGYREFPQHFPDDGWVEHDLGEMWSATLAAVRDALDGVDTADLVGIGITNQRETVCLWDRETLGAPRRAIVWQDRRTAAICQAFRDDGHEPHIADRTGLRLDPYFSATKLTWIRHHDPHAWSGVESGRTAVGTVDSYLIARMSRGLYHVTDATNASRTLLYDLDSGEWSERLATLFGVPLSALPEIVPSYGDLARTDPAAFLGLDLPISGIAGDQQSALVGQAAFTAGDAKCTYGTGSFLLAHTGEQIRRSRHGLLTTVALAHPDGRRDFALEGAIFVTGSAVQWLRDGLGIIESAPEVEALAASVPDSGGVVFVPALTGLGAPEWDPSARGLIIGITRGTTRAHLARATLDAIAFQVRDVADLMAADGQVELTRLAIDGGAAANDLLCQLQADALGMVVDRSAELQTTGLGAAFLAGLGTEVWASTDELVATRRSSGLFEPRDYDPEPHHRWREAVGRSLHWSR